MGHVVEINIELIALIDIGSHCLHIPLTEYNSTSLIRKKQFKMMTILKCNKYSTLYLST